jgi:hypothetical protein
MEIRKRKFRWIGHTLKKDDEQTSKVALQWNPQGNRGSGRPRNSWRRSTLREAGRSSSELRYLAADREIWKRLVDGLCSSWNYRIYYYYYYYLSSIRANFVIGLCAVKFAHK